MPIHVEEIDLQKLHEEDLKFNLYLPIQKSEDITANGYFSGIASSSSIDRDNDKISPEALHKMSEDLKRNSSVFFNHQHDKIGVGKLTNAYIEDGFLKINVKPTKAEGMKDVITQINEGILRSFSIGGKVKKAEKTWDENTQKEVRVIKDVECYEVSVVGIPANPDATIINTISKALKWDVGEASQTTKTELKKGESMSEVKKEEKVEKEVQAPTPNEPKAFAELPAKCPTCGVVISEVAANMEVNPRGSPHAVEKPPEAGNPCPRKSTETDIEKQITIAVAGIAENLRKEHEERTDKIKKELDNEYRERMAAMLKRIENLQEVKYGPKGLDIKDEDFKGEHPKSETKEPLTFANMVRKAKGI